jgi:uncharacterized protein
MKPRITLLTVGVDDLERAVRFYRDGLGLKTQGIVGAEFEYGAVAFFDLQTGLKLALWPRKSIARDTGVALGSPNPTDFTIGHNVSSRADVDAVMRFPLFFVFQAIALMPPVPLGRDRRSSLA